MHCEVLCCFMQVLCCFVQVPEHGLPRTRKRMNMNQKNCAPSTAHLRAVATLTVPAAARCNNAISKCQKHLPDSASTAGKTFRARSRRTLPASGAKPTDQYTMMDHTTASSSE